MEKVIEYSILLVLFLIFILISLKYRHNFILYNYFIHKKKLEKVDKLIDDKIDKIKRLKYQKAIEYIKILISILFKISFLKSLKLFWSMYIKILICISITILLNEILKNNFFILIFFLLSIFFMTQEILLVVSSSILTLNLIVWFGRANPLTLVIFVLFSIGVFFLYSLRYIFIIQKIKTKYFKFVFLMILFYGMIGVFENWSKRKYELGIRVIGGNINRLKEGSIELFSENIENNKIVFNIEKDNNIKNNDKFKNVTIEKFLSIKDDEVIIYFKSKNQVIKGKYIFLNNRQENTKVKDKNGQEIKNIKIEGKLIVVDGTSDYIFLDNSWGWSSLNEKEKIRIGEDNNFYYITNLVLWLFNLIYCYFKLYGKRSNEYYSEEILNKIEDTKKLFEMNKVYKILTFSMFGINLPNIWKLISLASVKNIYEIKEKINRWAEINLYTLLIFVLIFFFSNNF